ncbi:DUF817 domain-containing protein [Ktedonobacter racemifer]|uniref:DUF817 domain-containing protein n=1 Tax=Ktedonobacter racemifer TaxID=363277 RepID=UPI003B75D31B
MKIVQFLFHFITQEALSCMFPAVIFLSLALSKHFALPHRYDILLVICLGTQWIMYHSGLETRDEIKVIAVFHLVGLLLELYKVHMGSWAYPEEAWTKVGGVPLYSGFMYASVASYICQAWHRLHLEMVRWPSPYWIVPLGALIYLNFFTHHFIPDLRWLLVVLLACIFWRTGVLYSVDHRCYRMPLLAAFFLIGFFLWIAENIATFFGAWAYPDQVQIWRIVSPEKISSWFLLVIISILLVVQLKRGRKGKKKRVRNARALGAATRGASD